MKAPFVPRYVRLLYWRSNRFLTRHVPHANSLLLALSLVVGVGSGLGAVAFEFLIRLFQSQFDRVVWTVPVSGWSLSLGHLVILVFGGLVGGVLVATVAKSSRGHGVPDIMASVAIRGGRIPPRVAGDTAVTAAVCIGVGGSAGERVR